MLPLLVIALTRNIILSSAWVDSPDGPQVRAHHDVYLGFGVATLARAAGTGDRQCAYQDHR
ncbi:hypothetical protein A4G29_05565 [Mycobacterium kansasii]|nr:hypothetical protein A4G29_05565 [Mycobacterium kansasii]